MAYIKPQLKLPLLNNKTHIAACTKYIKWKPDGEQSPRTHIHMPV